MDEKEEKGFVIKDRRKLSGEESEESAPSRGAEQRQTQQAEAKMEERAQAKYNEASQKSEEQARNLPEVTLSTLVFSLSSSALVHLGEVPDPDTQSVRADLEMAKQIIDTIGMLQEKTRGNLDEDEERLIKSVLYDLRMRYVQKIGR